jgi:hypothetical protein
VIKESRSHLFHLLPIACDSISIAQLHQSSVLSGADSRCSHLRQFLLCVQARAQSCSSDAIQFREATNSSPASRLDLLSSACLKLMSEGPQFHEHIASPQPAHAPDLTRNPRASLQMVQSSPTKRWWTIRPVTGSQGLMTTSLPSSMILTRFASRTSSQVISSPHISLLPPRNNSLILFETSSISFFAISITTSLISIFHFPYKRLNVRWKKICGILKLHQTT